MNLACQFRTNAERLWHRARPLGWLGLVLGASVPLVSCSKASISEEPPERMIAALETFPLAAPELKTVRIDREFVGEVRAVQYGTIRPRSLGSIEAVLVDEGQAVKSGQVLFQMNTRELQESLRRAKAETETARAKLRSAQLEEQNTRVLFEKQVVSQAVMELATSKVARLQAKINESKAEESQISVALSFARVRAPFDGVVNRIQQRVGSLVDERDVLTTLTDTREVFVYFRMSEREYLEHKANDDVLDFPVSLRLANGQLHTAQGKIDAIESEFDRETGSIAFRARFPNPDGTLRHGSSGKVIVGRDLPNALLVPQRATFEVQGDLHVYVVDADNVAHARRIVPKARLKDTFVVESGLDESERFVAEGVQRIKDGTLVGVAGKG